MITNLFIFVAALWMVIKGSIMATKHSERLAKNFHLSKYVVGFIIVAIISILPETFISIDAAIKNIPSFGLGLLFGSNIADLTLIFAIIIWTAKRNIKVETKILSNQNIYPFLLLLPLILGLDGYFSRIEGLTLVIAGTIFYFLAIKGSPKEYVKKIEHTNKIKSILLLLLSMGILLVGAYFIVSSSTSIAYGLGISPILIGMLVVSLGTTVPELFFSINSIKKENDSLAIGDLLGTVLADATIVVGIIALINPFSFPIRTVYVSGIFMVIASFILFKFMKTGKSLSRKEAWKLFVFWLLFIIVEFVVNS